jgi:hypothetical protein
MVPLQVPDPGASLQELSRVEETAEDPMSGGRGGNREGKDWFRNRDVFADDRCSQAILDYLATTQVGRRVPNPAAEDARSEASEWGLRERRKRYGEEIEGRGNGGRGGGASRVPHCAFRFHVDDIGEG